MFLHFNCCRWCWWLPLIFIIFSVLVITRGHNYFFKTSNKYAWFSPRITLRSPSRMNSSTNLSNYFKKNFPKQKSEISSRTIQGVSTKFSSTMLLEIVVIYGILTKDFSRNPFHYFCRESFIDFSKNPPKTPQNIFSKDWCCRNSSKYSDPEIYRTISTRIPQRNYSNYHPGFPQILK